MIRKMLLILFALSLSGQVAKAANCTGYPLPYMLSNGTTADASQVMANFNEIINCVNALSAVTGPASSVVGHLATFANTSGTVLQDGGAFSVAAQQLANSAAAFGVNMLNGTIVPSNASNALTFTIQTLAGNTPSATDPVFFIFRSNTAGAGSYSVIKVTAALSVTIPTSSTMGFSNATPGRIWITAINNAGTVSLAVINCLTATSTATTIFPLAGWGIVNTVALGGPSNSSGVFYTTIANSAVPYSVLGYATYETGSTLGTAGTWNANPSRIELYRHGVPLPGQVVQSLRSSTGTYSTGSTGYIPSNTAPTTSVGTNPVSQSITPSSSANVLRVTSQALIGSGNTNVTELTAFLTQDSGTGSIATAVQSSNIGTDTPSTLGVGYSALANLLTATTFKLWGVANGTTNINGAGGSALFGGTGNTYINVDEIMS
jgi:hypothetical protein